MTPDEQALWELLQSLAVGRDRAITQSEIADLMNFGDTRRVQLVLHELVDVHELPVGATSSQENGPRGVFIPTTMESGAEIVANVLSRGWSTVRKGLKQRAIFIRWCGEQRPLRTLFEPEPPRAGDVSLCAHCGEVFTMQHDADAFCRSKEPLCEQMYLADTAVEGASPRRAA